MSHLHQLHTLFGGLQFEGLKQILENTRKARELQPIERHALALLNVFEGTFESALPDLLHAAENLKFETPWLHLVALVGRGLGETEKALLLLNRVGASSPEPAAVDEMRLFLKKSSGVSGSAQVHANQTNPNSKFALKLLKEVQVRNLAAIRNLIAATPDLAATSCEQLATCSKLTRQAGYHQEAARLAVGSLLKIPLHPESLLELGLCFQALGGTNESVGCFRALCRVSAASSEAHAHLGAALVQAGDLASAITALQKAIQLDPENAGAWRHLSVAHLQCGSHEEAERASRECLKLSPGQAVAFSQYLFGLNYMSPEVQEIAPQLYRRFSEQFEHGSKRALDLLNPVRDRIRIGYVSADLRSHPVASFIEPILANHNKTEFEVFAYSTSARQDQTTDRLRKMVTNWRNAWQLNDADLAASIRRDKIDILVDLSGHTPSNRLPVFAQRAASIQVTMIGCMQTTGLNNMDFRVTDCSLDPVGADSASTERLMRLDAGAFVFEPPAEAGPVEPLPCLRGGPFTFGCVNDAAKATRTALQCWADILHALPDARFLYVYRPGSRIRQTLEELGIKPSRIEERSYQPLTQFLELYSEIDLCLDPCPYNGLTMTLLGCWMGVPAVCLRGESPPARAAANIHQRLGLQGCVAGSTAEYIDKAVRLALDSTELVRIRSTLREQTQAVWCNGPLYTREFELNLKAALAQRREQKSNA